MKKSDREELVKALLIFLAIYAEWYAMQAYHPPVMAQLWLATHRFAAKIAIIAGRIALASEYNYYRTVETGG